MDVRHEYKPRRAPLVTSENARPQSFPALAAPQDCVPFSIRVSSLVPLLFLLHAAVAVFPVRAQLAPVNGPAASAAYSGGLPEIMPAPPGAQSPYSGSVPEKLVPGGLQLSLQDAIARGLKQNLGLLLSGEDIRTAQGGRWRALSELLPNLTSSTYMTGSQVDLAEFGFTSETIGAPIPEVVGPFAYFDARAYLTQSLLDWRAINRTHAATETVKSAQNNYQNARDIVVLAVGYAYLQAIADRARVETAAARLKTAEAVYTQASDRVKAGTSPSIDALRAQVEFKSQQQQSIQAKNDYAIAKLSLARVVGLAPGQEFDLTERSPYQPLAALTVDEALARAYRSRADFQAALANLRAAEYSRKAASAGYLPSVSLNADYGAASAYPDVSAHAVFDIRGTLTIPIFQGNRVHGDILEAGARLEQTHQRLESLRAQIDADVRTALLNLQSAQEQVTVAESNVKLADQTLVQSQDRFAAGVTDTVEVVQAQEAVARAQESYIASLYADNYARISLARALGLAEQGVKEFFKGQ